MTPLTPFGMLKMIKAASFTLAASFLLVAYLCPPSYGSTATMKLINDLESEWYSKDALLEDMCRLGRKFNKDVLSFWNPFIGTKRVKAFEDASDDLIEYVDNPEDIKDKDTLSAFADAKEAALLRAMRKRCPDVW